MPNDLVNNIMAGPSWKDPTEIMKRPAQTPGQPPVARAIQPNIRDNLYNLVQGLVGTPTADQLIGHTGGDMKLAELTPGIGNAMIAQESYERFGRPGADALDKVLASLDMGTAVAPFVEAPLSKLVDKIAAGLAGKAAPGVRGALGLRQAATAMPTGPVTHDSAQQAVQHLTSTWKGQTPVEVVPSLEHLPPHMAEAVKRDGAEHAGAFVAPDGKIYMLSDKLGSHEQVTSVLYHEALGHLGLSAKFRGNLDEELGRILQSHAGTRAEAEAWLAKNPGAYAQDPNRLARAAEEVLAAKSENGLIDAGIKSRLTALFKQWGRAVGMDLQMSDKELSAILRSAQQKVVQGKANLGQSGNRYIFIGEKGAERIAALPEHERHPIFKDMRPVSLAERMEKTGYDPEQIRKSTGWHRGAGDPGWRWEASDEGANFAQPFENMPDRGGPAGKPTIGEAFPHPALQAYPDLAAGAFNKSPGHLDWFQDLQGSWDEKAKELQVTPYAKDPRGTAIHELQHGIQGEEGWARGGNEHSAFEVLPPEKMKGLADRKRGELQIEHDNADAQMQAFDQLRKSPLLEDYFAIARKKRDFIENTRAAGRTPEQQAELKVIMAQERAAQKALEASYPQDREGYDIFKKAMNAMELNVVYGDKDINQSFDKHWAMNYGKRYKAKAALDTLTHGSETDIKTLLRGDSDIAHETYKSLAGEVEARDATHRMDMTPDERKATPPGSKEGYKPEDLIVDMKGPGGSSMSKESPHDPRTNDREQTQTGELQGRGGVRGGIGVLAGQGGPHSSVDRPPLAGLPRNVKVDGKVVEFGPHAPARQAAADYAKAAGIDYSPPTTYVKADPARAKKIASAYDAMVHAPNDPKVKRAYDAMIKETVAQWQAIKKTGLKVDFIEGDDPYGNPRNAIRDITGNNHMWVFPTDAGFGGPESAGLDVSDNPLLAIVPGETWNGKPVRANDIFRVVHDYFGHVKEGVGFRADGEENAWRAHSAMYSPEARNAMTSETRGQNSWVNFGPHAEKNVTASGADTEYAPQKVGLLPDWVIEEGAFDDPSLDHKVAEIMKKRRP